MTKHALNIKSIQSLTHDVLRIRTDKPVHFSFEPGQAADISINKPPWVNEKRSFTFTSLPDDVFLEFTIKLYPQHQGVTNALRTLHPGDQIFMHDVFGDIKYKGEGVFIAGGAGITPFISIFKDLRQTNRIGNNKLIFANKTKSDIILEKEFQKLLGSNFINILSDEKREGYFYGLITEDFLKKYIPDRSVFVYLCGPPMMMKAVREYLEALHVDHDHLIKESF